MLISVVTAAETTYRGKFDQLSREFYQTGNKEEILEQLKDKQKDYEADTDYDNYVFQAEAELLTGEIYEVLTAEEKAKKHFQQALEWAEKALDQEKNYLTYRLHAEALSRLFNYRGTFFIIRNSRQAANSLKEARERNPADEMGLLIEAMYKLNAPAVAGGSIKEGQAILDEILKKDHPVLNFIVFHMKAELAEGDNNQQEAQEFLDQAAQIFPNSPLIGEINYIS